MKANICSLVMILFLLFAISCEKEASVKEGKGKISFSPDVVDKGQLKSVKEANLASILITVKSGDKIVMNSVKLPLVKLDGNYITEPLSFETGNYELTTFAVLDAADNVLYAAPVAGTPSASLVSKPLNISFSVQKDQITKICPEVLPANSSNIKDFGLVNFIPNIIPLLNIAVCTNSFFNSSYSYTNATLTIYSGITVLGIWNLEAKNNQIVVDTTKSTYTIKVEKQNFVTYSLTLSNVEFKAKLKSPYIIVLNSDLTNGLIASYPFDGNANDASGNGNNGVVNGATLTTDRYGVNGKAYSFDGIDDYIDINPAFFQNRNQGTFSVWAKYSKKNDAQYIGIFANSHDFDNYFSLIRYDSVNQVISIYAHTPPEGANDAYVLGSTKIQLGLYYHLVMTCDGSNWNLYVNGKKETLTVKAGTNMGAWTNDISIDNFRIGGEPMPGFSKCYFGGVLDDIKIFNRALNDNEVLLLYNE